MVEPDKNGSIDRRAMCRADEKLPSILSLPLSPDPHIEMLNFFDFANISANLLPNSYPLHGVNQGL